jgi:hypothetical protein
MRVSLAVVSGRTVLVTVLAAAVASVGILAFGAGSAPAKYRQPGCAGFAKQVRKAKTGARKRVARARLRRCSVNRRVYNRVKDGRYVGVREDGEPIDITLCANGKFADNYGSPFQDVGRRGWKITASVAKGKYFTAVFAGSLGSAGIGIGERIGGLKFTGAGWKVGIDKLGRQGEYGPARRYNARGICRRL